MEYAGIASFRHPSNPVMEKHWGLEIKVHLTAYDCHVAQSGEREDKSLVSSNIDFWVILVRFISSFISRLTGHREIFLTRFSAFFFWAGGSISCARFTRDVICPFFKAYRPRFSSPLFELAHYSQSGTHTHTLWIRPLFTKWDYTHTHTSIIYSITRRHSARFNWKHTNTHFNYL